MDDLTTHLLAFVRARCITSGPLLLGVIGFNLWIAVSYLRIPASIARIIARSGGPPIVTGGAVRGTALFVLSCGITHLLTIVVLFAPHLDWLAVVWGLWTGLISHWTARRLAQREGEIIQTIVDSRQLSARLGEF